MSHKHNKVFILFFGRYSFFNDLKNKCKKSKKNKCIKVKISI